MCVLCLAYNPLGCFVLELTTTQNKFEPNVEKSQYETCMRICRHAYFSCQFGHHQLLIMPDIARV